MNSKKTFRTTLFKTGIVFSFILCVFATTATVLALDDYTTLAPLPGTTLQDCTGTTCKTNFQTYLPGLFNLLIGVAAVLAFAMISWGGFEYMTTDAINEKQAGRDRITEAIKGLILVIGAYAILYTINPQILEFNLNIEKPKLSNLPTGVVAVVPLSGASLASDAAVRSQLLAAGVKTYAGACVSGSTSGCVNLDGLQQNTITGLSALAAATCRDTCVIISGGTEGGHTTGSAHGSGTAVDILPQEKVNEVVTNKYSKPLNPCQTYSYGGGSYLWEPKGSFCGGTVASSGDHWHAKF